MDGRGGCCIARYTAGRAYDMSKVDQIMLRYRPIAPKPTAASSSAAASLSFSGGSTPSERGRFVKGKRRASSSPKKTNALKRASRRRRAASSPPEQKREPLPPPMQPRPASPAAEEVVTLPLLPENPAGKESPAVEKDVPAWMMREDRVACEDGGGADRTVLMAPQAVRVVGSCVTDTWGEGDGWIGNKSLGRTDEERRKNLERDTCPGFISDAWNLVAWTNGAYRRMVAGESSWATAAAEEGGGVVVAWVLVKEKVPLGEAAFTCRVRVQYTCGRGAMTVPCDVWRMDGGGFAWRLDVDAALSLGR